MSYVRWTSKCNDVFFMTHDPNRCPDETCPGSDLYIYDSVDDVIVCCGCPLQDTEFICTTGTQMAAHIEKHLAAGHHTRLSVLEYFRELGDQEPPKD